MRLTIKDLQRAITNAGNVSTFSKLYQAALGNTPLDIAPRLDLELPLPDPALFVQSRDAGFAKIILGRGPSNLTTANHPRISISPCLLHLNPGTTSPDFLKDVMEHVKPDILALNIDPLSLSADLRYSFQSALRVRFFLYVRNQESGSTRDICQAQL